jgi:hypothetical protein
MAHIHNPTALRILKEEDLEFEASLMGYRTRPCFNSSSLPLHKRSKLSWKYSCTLVSSKDFIEQSQSLGCIIAQGHP